MAEAQTHKAFPKETTLSQQNIITKGRLRPGLSFFFFPLAQICCRPKAIIQAYGGKRDGRKGLWNIRVSQTRQMLWTPAILKLCDSLKHFHVHNFISSLLSSPQNYAWTKSLVKIWLCVYLLETSGAQEVRASNFPHRILPPAKHTYYAHPDISCSKERCLQNPPDVLDFLLKAKCSLALFVTLWGE